MGEPDPVPAGEGHRPRATATATDAGTASAAPSAPVLPRGPATAADPAPSADPATAGARSGRRGSEGPRADGAPAGGPRPGRLAAWAELLRVSALFTVPGDVLAGAATAGARPSRRTLLAIGTSLCLYEAGMALNDWSDRDEDAVERPHRPIPSGRVSPAAALAAAAALTAAGLALAARAGRAPLTVATTLAAAVWAYDLRLKHTAAGPAAMASARALDLLLGAAATRPRDPAPALRAALPHAGLLAAHTYAVTAVSRHETQGGSTTAPLAALATGAAITAATTRHALHAAARGRPPAGQTPAALTGLVYARTALTPLLHAALNPSPPLTQRAVGAGIRAMIPLQAALAARAGAPGTGLALLGLAPIARRLARKVSPT
ncbi:SCO3242 family prenyltransferase [Streptomyces wuyuanensis]|uniref:SCO3242 family prenyltransferase n=1 Tax=Streptomyces wuyuanensis TaxID=1196353 RepID=UPI00380B5F8F